eukprot:13017338-Ditylum_brightwellii.AAC.1
MVEIKAGHHRLLFMPCVHLMGKVMTAAMVEFRAGDDSYDGRSWSQSSHTAHSASYLPHVKGEVKKEMRTAIEEVYVVHPRPSILRLGYLPQEQVMAR